MNNKGRSMYIDNISGFLITYIIVMHLFIRCDTYSYLHSLERLFPWFLPWFFFKSEMFFKGSLNINKLTHKLIIPVLWMSLLGVCLYIISCLFHGGSIILTFKTILKEILNMGVPSVTAHLWFLLALFISSVGHYFLIKVFTEKIIVVVTFFLSVVFYTITEFYRLPYYLIYSISALFFYSLGVVLKEKQFDNKNIIVALLIYIVYQSCNLPNVNMATMSISKGHNLLAFSLWFPFAISGIILINNIFSNIVSFKIPFLSYVGKNSMVFYLWHYILLSVIFIVLDYFQLNTTIRLILGVVFLTIGLLLIDICRQCFSTSKK